jgi:hypothetical protein
MKKEHQPRTSINNPNIRDHEWGKTKTEPNLPTRWWTIGFRQDSKPPPQISGADIQEEQNMTRTRPKPEKQEKNTTDGRKR